MPQTNVAFRSVAVIFCRVGQAEYSQRRPTNHFPSENGGPARRVRRLSHPTNQKLTASERKATRKVPLGCRRPARLFMPLPHRPANSVNGLRPLQFAESQSHLRRTPATSRFLPATANSRARVRLKRQLSRSTRRMIARAEIVPRWDRLPACRVFSRNRQAGSRFHKK